VNAGLNPFYFRHRHIELISQYAARIDARCLRPFWNPNAFALEIDGLPHRAIAPDI
jgi:hypothetical protein